MREEVASNIRFNIDIKEAKYTGKSVYSSDKNKVKWKRLKYAQGDETWKRLSVTWSSRCKEFLRIAYDLISE